ncbi:MAG TPA: hypothetical protein PLL14_09765, partial [Accumulibacter sp.]|nr:hypothetical protein [Accumulibacter sp.]
QAGKMDLHGKSPLQRSNFFLSWEYRKKNCGIPEKSNLIQASIPGGVQPQASRCTDQSTRRG